MSPSRTWMCILSRHEGCCAPIYARGLCRSHYNQARYLISEELETWESLEKQGRAMPKLRQNSPISKFARIQKAIIELRDEGVYPSASAINCKLGRACTTLRGDECWMRRQIFENLGLKIRARGPGFSSYNSGEKLKSA